MGGCELVFKYQYIMLNYGESSNIDKFYKKKKYYIKIEFVPGFIEIVYK